MDHHIILKLKGNLDWDGFHVSLEIPARETGRGTVERHGNLPPDPTLVALVEEHWRENHRSLGNNHRIISDIDYRIVPKKISQESPFQHRLERTRESARNLVGAMNRWLQSDGFRAIESDILSTLHPGDSVWLFLRCDDRRVQQLPWNAWQQAERFAQFEWAIGALDSRPLPSPPAEGTKSEASVRILSVFGDSTGLDLENDRQELLALPFADPHFLVQPNRNALVEALWEQSWDVLFFAGHSQTQGDRGEVCINEGDRLSPSELHHTLSNAVRGGLQLAIFNSCDGLGLARELDDLQLPAIVVMREAVPNFVAQTFIRHFLKAFGRGESLHAAFAEARQRLESLEDCFPCASWLPTLCCHPAWKPPTWPKLAMVGAPSVPLIPGSPEPDVQRATANKSTNIPLPPQPQTRHRRTATAIALAAAVALSFGIPRVAGWAANQQGVRYAEAQNRYLASRWYRVAILLRPSWGVPWHNLGYICFQNGDIDCAIQKYQKAAERGLPEGYARLSTWLIERGEWDAVLDAVNACLASTRHEKTRVACLKNLGWIFVEQERWEEADKTLTEAVQIASDSPHAQCLLAQVREHQDRHAEAREAWRLVIRYGKYRTPAESQCLDQAHDRLSDTDSIEDSELLN